MDLDLPDLSDNTYLITGSTSGIGRDAALRLARRGATVVLHGRDRERGRETLAAVREAGGDGAFVRADLADPGAVRGLARVVSERYDRLDGLVSNAALSLPDRETAMGTERTLAVNHLAPYLLVHDLAPFLIESAPARVVVTASGVHHRGEIDPDTLAFEDDALGTEDDEHDALAAYARSKLANVLFARELARQLPEGYTANCFHPGVIPGSGFSRGVPFPLNLGWKAMRFVPGMADTVEDGGRALASLAASPDVADVSGAYFDGTRRTRPAPAARDDRTARRLWERSASLVGVDPAFPFGAAPAAE
jgi:NAD(P)-dependent dehydrogenase (short-subunit alcohol dehydrogenase family)